jgi:hypothetical protein
VPLLFNFALEHAIRRVQVNQLDLKLHGTHQLLVYADDVNIPGRNICITKKNTVALIVASVENAPYIVADKTKDTVMSQDQNAGRINNT